MRPPARFTQLGALLLAITLGQSVAIAQSTRAANDSSVKLVKPSADVITLQQVQSRTFPNAYAAIEALHSNWLRPHNLNPPPGTTFVASNASSTTGSSANSASASGSRSSTSNPTATGVPRADTGIQVYLDGTRLGGVDMLKTIPIAMVYSILRINGTDAQARFGIGHGDGVIFVSSAPDRGGR